MDDNSIMPFGKHIGKKLMDVPATWFLWYADEATGKKHEQILKYIEDNRMCFNQEMDLNKIKNGRY